MESKHRCVVESIDLKDTNDKNPNGVLLTITKDVYDDEVKVHLTGRAYTYEISKLMLPYLEEAIKIYKKENQK